MFQNDINFKITHHSVNEWQHVTYEEIDKF